ncbi:MEDS domain-containing protein [Pseudonocardia bannensis]|uniref:MEDS domain-containing protein n=1 Tax=Pseudonocardia bannensis TaxID=630973 RepID=A0A848DLM8_9PSEU|nr:MEDS domain-containing protein [Pseudonocardia bannensis]NMH93284.1 hypothetical protein [Pseudonocardia bannensis]
MGWTGAVEAGDHACALTDSVHERDAVLLPFLDEGLSRGDKCVVALTDPDPVVVIGRLGNATTLGGWLAAQQLEVHGSADMLISSQAFSVENVLGLWERVVSSALAVGGFPFVRLAIEVGGWMPRLPDVAELIRYEAALNAFSARQPVSILCLYEIGTDDGSLIIDLIRTHPRLLLPGTSMENPYYLGPEHFRARSPFGT